MILQLGVIKLFVDMFVIFFWAHPFCLFLAIIV